MRAVLASVRRSAADPPCINLSQIFTEELYLGRASVCKLLGGAFSQLGRDPAPLVRFFFCASRRSLCSHY